MYRKNLSIPIKGGQTDRPIAIKISIKQAGFVRTRFVIKLPSEWSPRIPIRSWSMAPVTSDSDQRKVLEKATNSMRIATSYQSAHVHPLDCLV